MAARTIGVGTVRKETIDRWLLILIKSTAVLLIGTVLVVAYGCATNAGQADRSSNACERFTLINC